jgi:hypothetical protein
MYLLKDSQKNLEKNWTKDRKTKPLAGALGLTESFDGTWDCLISELRLRHKHTQHQVAQRVGPVGILVNNPVSGKIGAGAPDRPVTHWTV